MAYKRKLIEVAMPLEVISKASEREKHIRKGHSTIIHKWWSRKPLATCRAVLFASLVDDPSSHPELFSTEQAQDKERLRLFGIIERLVKWENSTNERVLAEAKAEIMNSTGDNPPPVYDPFCGGGSIPLEAQRLGLEAHGSDLNPVAVLISKALIEIPPKFNSLPPVNPDSRISMGGVGYKGASGLAEDVAYYGERMKKEAEKWIGHLYPKAQLPLEQGGGEATVIAWLWVRTVKCPNPACGCQMPLASKFWLSTKAGKKVWAQPIVEPDGKSVRFEIRGGSGEAPEGTVNRRGAKCICCGSAVPFEYIRAEGKAGRMSSQLMAIVAEGARGRVYLPPNDEHINTAQMQEPRNAPDTDLPEKALGFRVQQYGMVKHKHLFTNRQLTALCTFSDLIPEVMGEAYNHAIITGMSKDDVGLADGGKGAKAYSEAIGVYLAMLMDQVMQNSTSICTWHSRNQQMGATFARQALPMVWNFAECNVFSSSSGSYKSMLERIVPAISGLPTRQIPGYITICDAKEGYEISNINYMISTDPPYYDNIGYADLSDFFYVWLRGKLGKVYPDLFRTLKTPKSDELLATPYRYEGSRETADERFEEGFFIAFNRIKEGLNDKYPLSVYYAYKQTETEDEDEFEDELVSSTGWETMLEGLMKNEFTIIRTWPIRSEMTSRIGARETNSLASSIVIVCRPKEATAQFISRKDFMIALRKELPWALDNLREGGIAPVDLAQAAIGPGMAVYSRYKAVLEADGSKMSVRTALQIINQELEIWLTSLEGDLDKDTRFCVAWFEQFGMNEAPFGEADVLARAKNTATGRIEEKGLIKSIKGKVRIVSSKELSGDIVPSDDISIWMCVQHMLRALNESGESGVAEVIEKIGTSKAEAARSLAYRLYKIAEDKKLTEDALAYNSLVSSWMDIKEKAEEMSRQPSKQGSLL